MLRGSCAECSRGISLRYPLVELLTALITAGWFLRFESLETALIFTVFGLALVIISGVDIDYRVIPPQVSYPLMAFGIASSYFNEFISSGPRLIYSVAGFLSGILAILILRFAGRAVFKKEAMGLGDLKLMAAVGSFTGPAGVFWTLFIGSFAGSLAGIGMQISGKIKKRDYIPFGPFLAAGAVLYVLFTDFFHSFIR